MRQASGELLTCALTVQRTWTNITVSFIIHVTFDHAWAEHYPVTLRAQLSRGNFCKLRLACCATIESYMDIIIKNYYEFFRDIILIIIILYSNLLNIHRVTVSVSASAWNFIRKGLMLMLLVGWGNPCD